MKKYLSLLLMAFAIFACSDDNSNSPVTPKNNSSSFFPTSDGSYWIYDVIVDSPQSEVTQDSVYLSGPITVLDRSGYVFTTKNSATEETNDVYYSVEGSKIYAFSNFIASASFDGLPTEEFFEDQWLMAVDSSDSDWRIIKTEKEVRTINYGGQDLEVEVEVSADGERAQDTVFTINNETHYCQKYTLSMNVSMTLKLMPIAFDVDILQDMYLVNGIGKVMQIQRSIEMEIPGIGTQNMPSMMTKLIRYNIK